MTSGRPEQRTGWIPPTLTIAAIIAALGFGLAVWNLGSAIASSWLTVLVQLLGAVVGLTLTTWLVLVVPAKAFDTAARVAESHREAARAIRKRTPTLIAVLVLGAQAVGIIADNAFGADPWLSVAVQFLALGLFWVANELVVRDSKTARIVGRLLWLAVVVYLAWVWYLWRGSDLNAAWRDLFSGGSRGLVLVAAALILLVLLPYLVPRREADASRAA